MDEADSRYHALVSPLVAPEAHPVLESTGIQSESFTEESQSLLASHGGTEQKASVELHFFSSHSHSRAH
jgi:hypothetical protein